MFSHEEKKVESPKEFKLSNDVFSPIAFLQTTESNFHNNKPPNRTRLLKFQASNDKTRIWKVEIIPVQSSTGSIRRYDSIITPSNEPSSKWPIGSKHAAELYVRRLKDMFTAYGKTKLILDQEMDYPSYTSQIRQTQPGGIQQVPNQPQPTQQPQTQSGSFTNVPVQQTQPTQILVQNPRVPMNIVNNQRVQQPNPQTQRTGMNVIQQKQPESPRSNGNGNPNGPYVPYRNNQRNPQQGQPQQQGPIPQRKFPNPMTNPQIPQQNFSNVQSPNIRFPNGQSPIPTTYQGVNMNPIPRVQNIPFQQNPNINPQTPNPYLPNR